MLDWCGCPVCGTPTQDGCWPGLVGTGERRTGRRRLLTHQRQHGIYRARRGQQVLEFNYKQFGYNSEFKHCKMKGKTLRQTGSTALCWFMDIEWRLQNSICGVYRMHKAVCGVRGVRFAAPHWTALHCWLLVASRPEVRRPLPYSGPRLREEESEARCSRLLQSGACWTSLMMIHKYWEALPPPLEAAFILYNPCF